MRGLVNHEKRNLLAITLVYTIVICFILQYVIANDISGTADQINNFYGGIYNNYGNLFLGTLDQYYEMFIIVLMIPVSFVAVIQYRESSTSKCGEFLMQLPIKMCCRRFFKHLCKIAGNFKRTRHQMFSGIGKRTA